jgi:hypothetical protein
VASAACEHFERGPGIISMMVGLLIAGTGLLVAGLLAIGFGIPVKEFSFGNTLILVGAVIACTGIIILGLWTVVRELRNIALRLGPGLPAQSRAGGEFGPSTGPASDEGSRDQPAPVDASTGEPLPWHDEAASRDRVHSDVPSASEPAEAAPAQKQRRNLLFSSSSRKERERAQARNEPSAADPRAASPASATPAGPPAPEAREPPPATFDDAWPKSERSRTGDSQPPRRAGRTPSTFGEPSAGPTGPERYPAAPPSEEQPPVTVLKSGVVDGMAYSLYSDGSIEAQMPEGMMRFASIDELRAHLDQRP